MIKHIILSTAIACAALTTPVMANSNSLLLSQNIAASQSSNYSIKGNIKLVDSAIRGGNDNCYGTGGFADMDGYMQVTVRDANGSIIATDHTSNGKRPNGEYSSVVCNFSFKLNNIPKSNFYSIEIGRRGKLNYSFEQMQEMQWDLGLSLGT